MRVLVLFVVACAPAPTYLGTEVPKPCTSRDAEGCLGWMMERDLLAAELAIYDNAKLRGYVQRVAERLARVSTVTATPRVMIADHDETYATAGRRIVIARTTIEKLASEAELAGILAHELAHIEARHVMVSLFGRPESDNATNRRDAEAIADERAVVLLEKAGYAPSAMATALAAVLGADDEDHPPRIERIARVAQLGADRSGFVGRAEFLAAIDGMPLGRDPRLGELVDDAWVVPALGIAIDIVDHDRVLSADAILVLRRARGSALAYAVGVPWARELVARLDAPTSEHSSLGRITRGTMTASTARDDSPLGKLAHAIRETLPQPTAGKRVMIVEQRRGALVLELGGKLADLSLRAATRSELAIARPNRIVIEQAPCKHSLERDRRIELGEPIKCAVAAVETRRGE